MDDYKDWIERYPFLRIKDNSTCPWYNNDACWLVDIPDGWVKAFGEQMCDELMSVLGDRADEWLILQMKEKWGHLVIYWAWDFDKCHTSANDDDYDKLYQDIEDVLAKYFALSYHTCQICGAPATKWTDWHVASYCNDCYNKKWNC